MKGCKALTLAREELTSIREEKCVNNCLKGALDRRETCETLRVRTLCSIELAVSDKLSSPLFTVCSGFTISAFTVSPHLCACYPTIYMSFFSLKTSIT